MKLKLLQPYNLKLPGQVIDLPGGVGGVLVMRKIAVEIKDLPDRAEKKGRK